MAPSGVEPLPDSFAATRESLHALACYAISPARKARTGHIGLRPVDGGFGTPPFDDGSRILVRRDRLARPPGPDTAITTVRAAAVFLGVDLVADPGVGLDLPPFEPDRPLAVDPDASAALGEWYAEGERTVAGLGPLLGPGDAMSETQLWPEHFDLASQVTLDSGVQLNVGFSPGDGFSDEPYVYVGPPDPGRLDDPYWNAPFGAYRPRREMGEPLEFLRRGIELVRAASTR
jgi:hypothetical protein